MNPDANLAANSADAPPPAVLVAKHHKPEVEAAAYAARLNELHAISSPNTIPVSRPPIPSNLLSDLASCLESRWWGYGPRCAVLEQQFTARRGGWALATSSCTAALNVAAQLIRRSDGDEVIVPAITFVSTAMAFHIAGMHPIPVDVRPDTLLIDEESVIRHLTPRTRAVVVVHLYGQHQDVSGLRMLCDRHGLALIEDCAHRIGNLAETPAGDFACYSFNAVKEAPAGEGGLLWAREAKLESVAREITYLGMTIDTLQRSSTLLHRGYGFGCGSGGKLRLTDVAATFVLACLGHIDEWQAMRRSIFARYEKELPMAIDSVALFPRLVTDSCLMFVVRLPPAERSSIRRALADVGIATSTHYPSLSRHPLWSQFAGPCPVAEQAEDELLTLPCFPYMDSHAQDRVISAWETACR